MLKKYFFTLLMAFFIGTVWSGRFSGYGKLICETPKLQGFWQTAGLVVCFGALFIVSFMAGREHSEN